MPIDQNYLNDSNPSFIWGEIEAYASSTSVKQNESIDFHVWVITRQNFTIEIFKKGLNDILVHTDTGSAEPFVTNNKPFLNGFGWPVGFTLQIQSNWQSGAYIAKFSIQTIGETKAFTIITLRIINAHLKYH